MSYTKIRKIKIEDGKVIIESAPNNIIPLCWTTEEVPYFTKLLNEEGQKALDIELVRLYEGGEFQQGNNKWNKAKAKLQSMPEYEKYNWRKLPCKEWKIRESKEFKDLLYRAFLERNDTEKWVLQNPDHPGFYVWKQLKYKITFTNNLDKAKVYLSKGMAEKNKDIAKGVTFIPVQISGKKSEPKKETHFKTPIFSEGINGQLSFI